MSFIIKQPLHYVQVALTMEKKKEYNKKLRKEKLFSFFALFFIFFISFVNSDKINLKFSFPSII
jgi:hypothetical protein